MRRNSGGVTKISDDHNGLIGVQIVVVHTGNEWTRRSDVFTWITSGCKVIAMQAAGDLCVADYRVPILLVLALICLGDTSEALLLPRVLTLCYITCLLTLAAFAPSVHRFQLLRADLVDLKGDVYETPQVVEGSSGHQDR